MIELPDGVVIEDARPVEKRYRSAVAGLTRRIRLLYDAAAARFGKEGLDLVRDTSRAYGEEIAERARPLVKAGDVKSIGSFVIRVFNTIGGEGEVTEYTDERVTVRVRQCPYRFEDPAMCLAHTEMEKALVESLGEDVSYVIESSIPDGDAYCDHVIAKKNG
jgi:hypothetical protein